MKTPSAFFPLPDAQLPKIRVSPAQHEELRAFLLPMAREVVREGPSWGRTNVASARAAGWKLVAEAPDGVFLTRSAPKSYRGFGAEAAAKRAESGDRATASESAAAAALQAPPTAGQCFMGYSSAPCSLEDVMSSMYCETTEELRAHYARADGRRLLYRIVQSLDIRGYGGQASYFGLTRAHIEAAYVYWLDDARSRPDAPVLNVCTKGRMQLKGNLPLWIVKFYLKNFWNSRRSLKIEGVLTAAAGSFAADDDGGDHWAADDDGDGDGDGDGDSARKSRRVVRKPSRKNISRQQSDSASSAPLDMATSWVPNDSRAACYVCGRKFHRVRRAKHHCRSCGEVMCSNCTSYSKLSVPPMLARRRVARAELAPRTPQPYGSAGDNALYVTVGKVCHRCMDLRRIMHNNSVHLSVGGAAALRATVAATVSHDDGNDGDKYDVHSATYPPHDSGGNRDGKPVSTSSVYSDGVLMTRIRRESSLSSTEVCAFIESTGGEATGDTREAAPEEGDATGTTETTMTTPTTEYAQKAEALGFDDDDIDSNEDLEFHPVLANDVPIYELVADTTTPDASGSLSLFNPDGLFNLAEQVDFSDDGSVVDGDQPDNGARERTADTVAATPEWHPREPPLPHSPLSASTGTRVAASPTRSLSLLRATSWSRISDPAAAATATATATARAFGGDGRVSLADVKLAIADHAKLLEVLKREREDYGSP
ncbi:hypothetical protein PybrP1_007741 [[Pythium] brassicae (nom. inval.)]|nr:hypothetical protein PybrP1_007741 [[Pythium] brassicae (nom. inval.)]